MSSDGGTSAGPDRTGGIPAGHLDQDDLLRELEHLHNHPELKDFVGDHAVVGILVAGFTLGSGWPGTSALAEPTIGHQQTGP